MTNTGTPDSFGARLREHRERQHVELQTIADQTKIKLSLLEALERDDLSRWPGGIFRRAFLRAYAQAVGLDPDPIVREFVDRFPDPDEFASVETSAPGHASDGPLGRAARFRAALSATVRSLSRGGERMSAASDRPAEASTSSQEQPHKSAEASRYGQEQPDRSAETSRDGQEQPDASAEGSGHAVERAGDSVEAPGDIAPFAETAREDEPKPLESPAPDASSAPVGPDIESVAQLCTAFVRAAAPEDLYPLLERTADLLNAAGIVLWLWDPDAGGLRATVAHGYSDAVLSQLPMVDPNADNATAAAFRLAQLCVVNGSGPANGALAVPLATAGGCGGVLGIELRAAGERNGAVRAAAMIVGAQLAAMIPMPGREANRKLA